METSDRQQTIKEVKHLFMTYRNGIVSDALRNAGMPYHVIFGLQLPQLSDIARAAKSKLPSSQHQALAKEFWADRMVREARLLACYLFDPEGMSEAFATNLAEDVRTREEADILCFRLLRHLPYARELAEKLLDDNRQLVAYCGEALKRNLQ